MEKTEVILKDLITLYEEKVPLSLSMSFDHNGLKVGRDGKKVSKVLTCLELTRDVVETAIVEEIDVIFVHHDPLFHAPNFLRTDDPHSMLYLDLLKSDIALYVSHTNLDIVTGGLNDYIFNLLGGQNGAVLDESTGLGRIGKVSTNGSIKAYIDEIIAPQVPDFKVTRNSDLDKKIETVAVVNGSGADFIEQAYAAGADLYITGDVDYHSAMFGVTYEFPIIDIGHDFEFVVAHLFKKIIEQIGTELHFELDIIEYSKTFSPWSDEFKKIKE